MGRASRDKGRRGEAEVVRLWRLHGWPGAHRSPGSGALRPFGAGDLSPYPGDVMGIEPFLVEVKWDERAGRPGRGGDWPGVAFTRATLHDLERLYYRHLGIVGRRWAPLPAAFIRASRDSWTVYTPDHVLEYWLGHHSDPLDWVGLAVEEFFDMARAIAPPGEHERERWPKPLLRSRSERR